jgi:hypothetical protein
MQGATRVGRQADDVARVGRNFGVNEDDMKHARIVSQASVLMPVIARFGAGQDHGCDVRCTCGP